MQLSSRFKLRKKETFNLSKSGLKNTPGYILIKPLAEFCVTFVQLPKQDNLLDLEKRANDSFLSKGFKNSKKGVEKFDAYKRRNTHRLTLSNNLIKKKEDSVLISNTP